MIMKMYIAGPISHVEDGNIGAFALMKETLKRFGIKAVSPHDLFTPEEVKIFTHYQFMKRCVKELVECDAVVTLADWHNSKGATQEKAIADILEIDVIHFTNLPTWFKKQGISTLPVTEAEEVIK